jgi:hypothetical protein
MEVYFLPLVSNIVKQIANHGGLVKEKMREWVTPQFRVKLRGYWNGLLLLHGVLRARFGAFVLGRFFLDGWGESRPITW